MTEAYKTGDTKWVKISIVAAFVQLVTLSVLEVVLIILHSQEIKTLEKYPKKPDITQVKYDDAKAKAEALAVYFALYIVAQIFQFYFCVEATYNKNTIQVIAWAIFNLCIFGYSVIQVFQHDRAITLFQEYLVIPNKQQAGLLLTTSVFEYILVGLAAIFCFSCAFQAHRLYQVYGWSIYKKIGADMRMRRIYRMYQIFIVFLKVDVFFFLAFSVQYLVLVIYRHEQTVDLAVHIVVSLCVTIVLLTVAYLSVRREYRFGMIFILIGLVGLLVYFIFKLYQLYNPTDYLLECQDECPTLADRCRDMCTDKFGSSRIILTMFLIVNMLLGLITGFVAYKALQNFDHGLRFHLTKQPSSIGMVNLDGQDPNKRWSIL
ncbi:hypothetical protein H4R34_002346 [Dimargaris verticillata]|uniref:Uncharacterized protein n=1 Tax=Dimargaris verticillata TaxID=2761393 RepID=A0A9W8B1Z2_9FUNG|nr:hypothetical protein H4R34_002346 [Dimargaris verticillata]